LNNANHYRIAFIALFMLTLSISHAQKTADNRVDKWINVTTDSVFLDSNIVAITTLEITHKDIQVKSSKFGYNPNSGYLLWYGEKPALIKVKYRTIKFDLKKAISHKDSSKIEADLNRKNPFYWPSNAKFSDPFGFSNMNTGGSISRGISFGNNQDLGVNSNLSLQLNGKISEDVSILASITDNNIPIQPEGNTLQLQDFDQAFIQIFNPKFKLTAGDFWINKPKSYFLTYKKKAQGLAIKTDLMDPNSKTEHWKLTAGLALSKGKFARNLIQGQEGNQGPYKLLGANNERFIIVLSGTERVFIDGKLLTRGQANDYTVDYNTAEITFTPTNLITKDRRIIVEFQYSDKNYARSLLQFSSDYKKDKWTINFNVYSEQDSKNQPLQQTLSEDQKIILNTIGDDLNLAFTQGIDSIGYSSELALYKQVDSLGYNEVFVYSTHEDSAFYQLSFTQVGQGNGNYVLEDFTAFGRVYKWVKPDTVSGDIILKGDYEPIRFLAPPQKRQMVTAGAEYSFSKKTKIGFEGALSNADINTFSTLDANDNTGYGFQAYWETNKKLSSDTSGWYLTNKIKGEFRDANFSPIERYRLVEFERDWNLLGQSLDGNQIMGIGELGLQKKGVGKFNYYFNTFNSIGEFQGIKNGAQANIQRNGIRLIYNGNLTQTKSNNTGQNESSNFIRHETDFSKDIKWLRIGFKDILEQNVFKFDATDSLLGNSYQFYDWQAYISNANKSGKKNSFKAYYRQRKDKLIDNNLLSPATSSDHYGASMGIITNRKHKFKTRVEYRRLRIDNDSLSSVQPDETLLGRLEYSTRILKGFINTTTFYEIGSGQELKREFVYIQVQAGQGIYAWNDYNDDGIKDISEFEISAFPDQADYIRVFTPTSEYVKTFTNQFNQSLRIKPSVLWYKKKGVLKFISRFDSQSSFRIDRKTNNESPETAYNPFETQVADTNLVTLNSSIRNTVFFNRSNPKYGFDYTYKNVGGKSLLTSGFDSRSLEEHELRIRWNLNRKFTFLSLQKIGKKVNSSDYTSGRNYHLDFISIKPKFSFQPNTSFRISIVNETSFKSNALDLGGETAEIVDIGAEFRLNKVTKGSITATFNYIQIDYDGEVNSALGFEMLNGLKNGTNFTWNINFQRTLANNLQLSLNYLGRKSEENKAIHTGGIQVRAFF
jgi:hypothetical protein